MDHNSAIDNLPPLRDVINAHNLRAEKKLGQNFLLDGNITDKIARFAVQSVGGTLSGHHVIEIGSGPGGLTRSLLKAGAKTVTAVEFDPRAVEALQGLKDAAEGRLQIIQADALTLNLLDHVPGPRMIVANLPYNIATPLLIGWLKQIRADMNAYDAMILMFQKEVAQRIVAAPKSKAYGRLSVMAGWICDAKKLFDLPPSAFTPPPKVTSSIVQFTPKILGKDAPPFETMETLLAAAFGQRRKMIRKSLCDYENYLRAAQIDDTLRAEDLCINDFIKLAKLCDVL